MRIIGLLFVVLSLFSLSSVAQEEYDITKKDNIKTTNVSVFPLTAYQFGYTKYIFEDQGFDVNLGLFTVKSELDFPLDVPLAGIGLSFDLMHDSILDSKFEIRFMSSIANPRGTMLDVDFINQFEFSHTDSDVDLWSVMFDVEYQKRIYGVNRNGLFLHLGYKLQRISQDLINLDGWQQVSPDSSRIFFSLEGPVGGYEVTYSVPSLGLSPKMIGDNYQLDALLAGSIMYLSDQDHHLLRNFTTESSGLGYGLIAGLNSKFYLSKNSKQTGWFISLGGELSYYHANLEENLIFYGDDPGTTEDETGLSFDNIPHKIQSFQGRLKLSVGTTW